MVSMVFRYYWFGRSNIRYIFTLLGCFTTLALLVLTPDSMDVLAQRWFMVGRLADGWRWFCNVGPT